MMICLMIFEKMRIAFINYQPNGHNIIVIISIVTIVIISIIIIRRF